ncbi:peptidoglycan-binding protein [Candidatus Kaiserbacteria bacterium]|nr:peptidoglycan-binding protein [Candidatus Kaiserbacteria bacterium]
MINTLETKKVAIAILVVAMIFGAVFALSSVKAYALTEAQVQSILSLLSSFGADQATINNVDSSLRGLPTSGTGSTGTTACSFTRSLTVGATGDDVTCLQTYLQGTGHFTFTGAKGYFGSITQSAVAAWQAANGVSPAVGYFGPLSQAKYTAVAGSTGTTGGTTTGGTTTTPAPTGTGLTVGSAGQPAASLAPDSAARVPFTRINVTAGTDGDVVLNSVSVKRVGLAANAVFSGVILVDENGVQLGTSKTLGSNDQAIVGEAVTIKAGQTRTFTVAGNMAADNSTRDGQVVGLNVVGVNTSATVSGSLPISGTQHTVNASLAIGSATFNISSFDPNSAQTKEIGTTGTRFAGIRVTAGSAEDIRIRNIRWNQTGSAGSTDFINVKTIVDGTEYPTTVSADGKFYTSNFGAGLVVSEGNNVDIYVKGDIVGGSNRTIVMDIDKDTDVYITGETFGYGITGTAGSTASAATDSSQFTTGTPFFDASHMTISAGSASTIQKSASVPAQNIAVNVPNQPLGAFETDIKGEAINVSGMTLTVASTTGSGTGLLTNVTIVDQNGAVVAGPVDATYTSALVQTLTFTDSITIPVGKMVYSIKGKVASGIGNGGTYIVTVTPSGWTSPTGDVTGNAITISQGAFTLNTMTVRAADLAITVSATPVAQNITAGATNFTFANYQFDATQSGEDVRFSSMIGLLGGGASGTEGAYNNLSACQLWDGTTALNTGSNVVDPSAGTASSTSANTFTFDSALTIPKGTIKTLALKCNLSSSAHSASTYQWGIANTAANITVTGVTSSNSVTETVTASNGQLMTVAAVSVVVSKDSSSPSYTIASAGSTGITAGVINFRAANESITLQRVGLVLTNTSSSSPGNLTQVTLYDGNTPVGTAIFTGASTRATSTLSVPVTLPKDTDKDLTVKIDLANIGTSQSGTQGALIAVDVDTNSTNTQGVGQESGTTVNASGSTAFDGIRVFKSYPTFAKLAIPSTVLVTSTMDLYRFSVTANSKGSIGIYKFTVNIATSSTPENTSSTTVTNLKILGYTDSGFSSAVSGFTIAGQLNDTTAGLVSSGNTDVLMTGSTQGQDYLQIPATATYYFRVVADVTLTGSPTGGTVTTNLQGDAEYPANGLTFLMANAASTTAFTNAVGNDFIWSPNATTTSNITHEDWTNGYFVPGLPADNMDSQVIVK